jgi:hypothetical protein
MNNNIPLVWELLESSFLVLARKHKPAIVFAWSISPSSLAFPG